MAIPEKVQQLLDQNLPIRLDICGGEYPYGNGFLNVDIRELPYVDVVTEIRNLPFDDNTVDEIFSCGTLEHFNIEEVKEVMAEFYRVLKSSGKVSIGVPDLTSLVNAYSRGLIDFELLNQYLYGAQANSYDLHKCVYDYQNMSRLLSSVGFRDIERVPYSMPFHLKDYMLEVRCVK